VFWVPDGDHRRSEESASTHLCIGYQKCISRPMVLLDGCPWDTIEIIPTDDWEAIARISLPDLPPPVPTLV
jgi:hypothetical protein